MLHGKHLGGTQVFSVVVSARGAGLVGTARPPSLAHDELALADAEGLAVRVQLEQHFVARRRHGHGLEKKTIAITNEMGFKLLH